MDYPVAELKFLEKLERYQLPGDTELLQFDFIGIQNYTREIVKHSWFVPHIKARKVKTSKGRASLTTMDWKVWPASIYQMLKKLNRYEGIKELYITENGAAFKDIMEQGEILEDQRINYLKQYMEAVLRAKQGGVKVKGYFVWTFTDNFEWAEGFRPRFGLVHIDFRTQQRTVKASGKWYASFLK